MSLILATYFSHHFLKKQKQPSPPPDHQSKHLSSRRPSTVTSFQPLPPKDSLSDYILVLWEKFEEVDLVVASSFLELWILIVLIVEKNMFGDGIITLKELVELIILTVCLGERLYKISGLIILSNINLRAFH